MRGPLNRAEAALGAAACAVLAVGAAAAVVVDRQDDDGSAPRPPVSATRTATPDATQSATGSPTAPSGAAPTAGAPTAAVTTAPPPPSPPPSGPPSLPPAGAQSPGAPQPADVARAFFDAAVQGRDGDALSVGTEQALSDLREYEAWDTHRFTRCGQEQGSTVCLFESGSTFLRLVLDPDPSTGWRVVAIG